MVEAGLKIFAFGFIWCDNIEFMLANQDSLKICMYVLLLYMVCMYARPDHT